MAKTEVLVGTRKGLFVLRGDREGPLEVVARHFDEVPVDFACYDPRTDTYLAGVTHFPEEFAEFAPGGIVGPKIWFTGDPDGHRTGSGSRPRDRRFPTAPALRWKRSGRFSPEKPMARCGPA
ncbi:MAG: hypothetical protein WD602_05235 [Actinomycetota bacterium]